MRRRHAILVLLTLALGLASAGPSHAAGLAKGTLELGPSLAYAHSSYEFQGSSDFSTTTLDVNAFLGYCLNPRVELGGSVLVSYQSVEFPGSIFGNASATSAGLTGGITLNFSTAGNAVPYLRASLGFLANSGDATEHETTVLAPMLEGGLRLMVGNSASVNFAVGYQHRSDAFGVQDESANVITFGVGVSVFTK